MNRSMDRIDRSMDRPQDPRRKPKIQHSQNAVQSRHGLKSTVRHTDTQQLVNDALISTDHSNLHYLILWRDRQPHSQYQLAHATILVSLLVLFLLWLNWCLYIH